MCFMTSCDWPKRLKKPFQSDKLKHSELSPSTAGVSTFLFRDTFDIKIKVSKCDSKTKDSWIRRTDKDPWSLLDDWGRFPLKLKHFVDPCWSRKQSSNGCCHPAVNTDPVRWSLKCFCGNQAQQIHFKVSEQSNFNWNKGRTRAH